MIISGLTAVGIIFPDDAQKEDALIHGGVYSKVHYRGRRRTTLTADDGGRCIARHRYRVQRLCCLIRFDQSVTGGKKNVRIRAEMRPEERVYLSIRGAGGQRPYRSTSI